MPDTNYDHLKRRCPRLGSIVTFQYCRTCGEELLLCQKVADCWWEYFDIINYLKTNLPEHDFKTLINARPKPKVTSLLELITQAKAVNNKK